MKLFLHIVSAAQISNVQTIGKAKVVVAQADVEPVQCNFTQYLLTLYIQAQPIQMHACFQNLTGYKHEI